MAKTNETKDGFGTRLREAIDYLDLSQREFAEAIGVHAPNVSMWMNGKLDLWGAIPFMKAQIGFPACNFFYVTGGTEYGALTDVVLSRAFYHSSKLVGAMPVVEGEQSTYRLEERIRELEATNDLLRQTVASYKNTIDTYEQKLGIK
jgi:transcriptional regulator with XRE-family HTH domain